MKTEKTDRSPRLRELADAAGVSFITAWRSLNAPHMVSPKTRAKVDAAAENLGYVANAAARSLVTASSGIIGVVVPTLEDSIFSATVQGISDTLTTAGLELLVGISNYDRNRETELVRAFVGRQVDGLVLTGSDHSDAVRSLLGKKRIATVEMWDLPDQPIDMVVGFSNQKMAEDATRWLIQKGYQRIAFASPPGRARALEREKGYFKALKAHDLYDHFHLSTHTEADMRGGAETFRHLMAREVKPDAIFFNGDSLAAGALFEASELGLRVPQDIAILGLHDTMIAEQMKPGLTSVRIPRYEIGRKAAGALLARLKGEEHVTITDVGYELVARDSA